MKRLTVAGLERIGLVAAWMVAAAFLVSFVHGVRWPLGEADPPPAAQPRAAVDPAAAPAGRVQVLNASRRSGMARMATDRLREAGFDVVEIGNLRLPEPADSSVVLDRTGDPAVARAVAQRLGIASVRTEPDSTLFVDATVVIGMDWQPDGRSR